MIIDAALVGAIFAGLTLLVGALASAYVKVMAAKIMRTVDTQSENIQKIEVATNSMKDALVKATGDAKFAEGKLEGKAEQKAETP